MRHFPAGGAKSASLEQVLEGHRVKMGVSKVINKLFTGISASSSSVATEHKNGGAKPQGKSENSGK